MGTKRIDIRLRAAGNDQEPHWRKAKGWAKDSWQGKVAIHAPLAKDDGQLSARRNWQVSHLPSGYRILDASAWGMRATKGEVEAAIDYACKDVHGWVHAMEFDHRAVEDASFKAEDLRPFRDAVSDHLKHAGKPWFSPPPPPELAEVHDQMFGAASTYVDCDAGCGHSASVEPDAWYKCPECGKGMIKSPIERLIRGEYPECVS